MCMSCKCICCSYRFHSLQQTCSDMVLIKNVPQLKVSSPRADWKKVRFKSLSSKERQHFWAKRLCSKTKNMLNASYTRARTKRTNNNNEIVTSSRRHLYLHIFLQLIRLVVVNVTCHKNHTLTYIKIFKSVYTQTHFKVRIFCEHCRLSFVTITLFFSFEIQ